MNRSTSAIVRKGLASLLVLAIFTVIFSAVPAVFAEEGQVGPNLAAGCGGTAQADTTYQTFVPSHAFDGDKNFENADSRWISENTAGGHWLSIDLGAEKEIGGYILYAGFWNKDHMSNPVKNFCLQSSTDGKTWADIPGAEKFENDLFTVDDKFKTVKTRYVRFYTTDAQVRVYELEIYAPDPDYVYVDPAAQPSYKSKNYNRYTAFGTTYRGNDYGKFMKVNDGITNANGVGHTNRTAGNGVNGAFDLGTIWTPQTSNVSLRDPEKDQTRTPIPTYNKAVYYAYGWNTDELCVYHAPEMKNLNGNPSPQGDVFETPKRPIYANRDTVDKPDARQAFSFSATNDRYAGFKFNYLTTHNAVTENNPEGKTGYYLASTAEFELYYVTPHKVMINNDICTASGVNPIALQGVILDVDGDEVLDSSFGGLKWSITGGDSDKVVIDAETGIITPKAPVAGDIVLQVKAEVNSENYNTVYAEKKITITSREIIGIEITDVPDFIMTNKEQDSVSTFYPGVNAYGRDGEKLEGKEFIWSLKEPVAGIELTNSSLGSFTVSNSVTAPSFTLVCKPMEPTETASAEVTVLLNQKKDLLLNKIGWTQNGWQVSDKKVGAAVDGNSDTEWDSGTHSRGSAQARYDMGEAHKINYFRVKLGNILNSDSLVIAGSNSLETRENVPVEPPATPDVAFKEESNNYTLPYLSPYTTSLKNGTLLWSGRSAKAEINPDYPQNHVISDKEITRYFDSGPQECRYIGLVNQAISRTDYEETKPDEIPLGHFTVYDFEVYNTAPNYHRINLPEETDVTSGAAIPLTAVLYNGVAAEEESGLGVWSAEGDGFAFEGNKLVVSGGTDFKIAKIAYTYESDLLDTVTTVYACKENGKLRFSNTAEEFLGLTVNEPYELFADTIYVPEGTTVEALKSGIHVHDGLEAYVLDENGDEPAGNVQEAHMVYVFSGTMLADVFHIAFKTVPPVSQIQIIKNGPAYTASIEADDLPDGAVLIFAEYNEERLLSVHMSSDVADNVISVELTPARGNKMKAMLLNSFGDLKPIRPFKEQIAE